MLTMCKFLSLTTLALAGMTGCYDLSTDGPRREDFVLDRATVPEETASASTPEATCETTRCLLIQAQERETPNALATALAAVAPVAPAR